MQLEPPALPKLVNQLAQQEPPMLPRKRQEQLGKQVLRPELPNQDKLSRSSLQGQEEPLIVALCKK